MIDEANRPVEVEDDRIVRPAEAEKLSGLSNMHLSRLEAKGEFPPRFKLAEDSGPYGAVGWLYSDIQAWLRRRASTARSTEAEAVDA